MSRSISSSTSPTPCSIPESVIKGRTDGDRESSRTVNPHRIIAAKAALRLPDIDADHCGRDHFPASDHPDVDPGAVDRPARSLAAFAGAAAETRKRPVSARHRRLWPRPAVAHHLWWAHLTPDRLRRHRGL